MADTKFNGSVDVDALSVAGTTVTGGLTSATAGEVNMAADVSSFIGSYVATSPAAIPATVRFIELNHASTAIEKTIASMVPYAGQLLVITDTSASGTAAHKVTITTGTFNGSNKVVTLDAPKECVVISVDSAGNGTVVANVGTAVFSG